MRAPLISPRPASRSSRIPAPINDLAKVNDESGIATKVQEYLRSGGTPRPNTHMENVFARSMSFARGDSVVKSGPRTPTISFGWFVLLLTQLLFYFNVPLCTLFYFINTGRTS